MTEFLAALGRKCGCIKREPPDKTRLIRVGAIEVEQNRKFASNRVKSSKYTLWNFVPVNLFEQMRRLANAYFLIVSIVGFAIDSPVSPLTSVLPLVAVVSVTALKQGYEDWLRHKADNEVNFRSSAVVRGGQLIEIRSMDIQVGDIVRISANDGMPCDLVMLSSSEESGECYITTANLDGETNLKVFTSLPVTRGAVDPRQLQKLVAHVECEEPTADLYSFNGTLRHGENTHPLGPDNVLLRGSRLRETEFAFGCAIYTGPDTKISLNSKPKALKTSAVESVINKFLIVYILLLIVEAAVLTTLKVFFYKNDDNVHAMWYMPYNNDTQSLHDADITPWTVGNTFLEFTILLNYIIPISMYVTIELQKFVGSKFFEWDVEMFDETSNEPAKANTSDLNEELGQVEYLFTDKTGTLTENNMQFRQCSIYGVKYMDFGGMICEAPEILNVQPTPIHVHPEEIVSLLRALALCHTIRIERRDENLLDGFGYDYQASSPDEKALVEACRRYGMVYHGVKRDKHEVTYRGKKSLFDVRHVLEFDPTRKRMSVIVEDEEGRFTLYCKGAETAIFPRIIEGDVDMADKHVTEYAMLGLRTLVVAKRSLTSEEFIKCDNLLNSARSDIEHRSTRLAEAYAEVESNLALLGVTAVEDELQDGVGETITALRKAGIKVWVLTGDKEETAVNISYSTGHFSPGMEELRLTKQQTRDGCRDNMQEIQRIVKRERAHRALAFIMDGASLALALQFEEKLLTEICMSMSTVLCCRMSPLQKAQVVKLIKDTPAHPVTAAIGDGANDVSMILEADVGLGIMGKEGRQAVRSSDYAFARFRFLQRVILVHGHYFYRRIAQLVLYFFYKNLTFITAQLYFAFSSAFSAQPLYNGIFLTLFNITFTSLPILIYGLFEKHVPPKTLLANPALYKKLQRNRLLSIPQFFKWNALALWHSASIYFFIFLVLRIHPTLAGNGTQIGVEEFGAFVITIYVFVCNIKLMLESYDWHAILIFSFALTLSGFFILIFFWSEFLGPLFDAYELVGTLGWILTSLSFWLLGVVLVVGVLLPDLVLRVLRDTFDPLFQSRRSLHHRKIYTDAQAVSTLRVTFATHKGQLTISQTDILNESA